MPFSAIKVDPSLNQEMVGVGIPSAIQNNEAKFPLITVTSSVVPAPSRPGGTEDGILRTH